MDSLILNKYMDVEAFFEWAKTIESNIIVLDLETNNKEEIKADIYGIGVCFDDDQSFYIPIRNPDTTNVFFPNQEEYIYTNLFTLACNKELTGHNIIYDVLVLKHRTGLDFYKHIQWDTILLKHLLDEERPFGLKELGVKEFGVGANSDQLDLKENVKSKGGRWTKDEKDMWMGDTEILGKYCAMDCHLTYKLLQRYLPQIKQQNLLEFYETETLPLYKLFTIPMKLNGVPVNTEHFYKLKSELQTEINILEEKIYKYITPLISEWEIDFIAANTATKPNISIVQTLLQPLGIELPLSKTGGLSIAKPGILKLLKQELPHKAVEILRWTIGEIECPVSEQELFKIKKEIYLQSNEQKHLFNINSNLHLSWLFFNKLNCTPLSKTEGGAPQIDEDFLDSVKHIKFVQDLIDSKKLKKLLSTYVEGFIERFHNGKIYPSFLQFGTTSGRYSCTNPNLQNLVSIKDEESGVSPLVLKYANQIRKGIAVTSQYQIVNADFSQLEVVCFSIASGETIIQDMFRNNLDFYSGVAIKVWKIPNVSADKKAPNFLKKINPTARQNSKQFALGIPYGAAAHRISEMLKISKQEAQHIIDDYLESFPQLAQWMEEQKQQVITQGFVKNMFGRIRHLEKAKNLHEWYGEKLLDWKWADKNGLSDERRTLKNLINLSRNYPIQSLAACIVNRSAIEIMKTIDKEDIKAYPILQVHDELTFVCTIEHSQRLKEIMKHCMENTVKLPVALTAEPLIADNWGDAK